MSTCFISKIIADYAFFLGRRSILCLAGIRMSWGTMDSLREPLGYPIRTDVSALRRDVASLCVMAPGEGRYSHHCQPVVRGCWLVTCTAVTSIEAGFTVVIKSRRNQICLFCHSHSNSASSEGMGLKGCSVSRKEWEGKNVNKNRPYCQSMSDDFGYPVLKVSKHIRL